VIVPTSRRSPFRISMPRASAPSSRTGGAHAAQQAVVDYSDALIGELKRADVVVLGCRCTTRGPSTLKAYFDHVARCRGDLQIHRKGPSRPADRQEGVRVRRARRDVRRTPNDTRRRSSHFLSFLGMSEHRVRLRRKGSRSAKRATTQPRARGGRDRCAGGARNSLRHDTPDSCAQVTASRSFVHQCNLLLQLEDAVLQ